MHRPTVWNRRTAVRMWASVASGPRETMVIPSPMVHGVLGIARMRGLSGSQRRICSRRTPAAVLTTSLPRSAPRISPASSTPSSCCGFSETRTALASRATERLSTVARTPCFAVSASAASVRRVETDSRAGASEPERMSPRTIASPTVPQPRTPRVPSLSSMPSDLAQPGTRPPLGDSQRIVVKLGTQVVTHDGRSLALGRLMSLVEEMARLRSEGRQILLVSSGAVALGMKQLGLTERPRSLGLRQACAAVGQGHLVALYTSAFAQLGVTAAQVLLTESDLGDRDRALCVRTTLMRLLELRAVPVLNENDSVSIRELVEHRRARGEASFEPAFGDNDGLSARVALGIDADLLVLLTDVDGLYTGDPRVDRDARRLEVLDAEAHQLGDASPAGTGGMASKVEAARVAARAGVTTVIASGS